MTGATSLDETRLSVTGKDGSLHTLTAMTLQAGPNQDVFRLTAQRRLAQTSSSPAHHTKTRRPSIAIDLPRLGYTLRDSLAASLLDLPNQYEPRLTTTAVTIPTMP